MQDRQQRQRCGAGRCRTQELHRSSRSLRQRRAGVLTRGGLGDPTKPGGVTHQRVVHQTEIGLSRNVWDDIQMLNGIFKAERARVMTAARPPVVGVVPVQLIKFD